MVKFWRRKGAVARITGFAHIDGPDGARWPPPRPRGVVWAFVLMGLLQVVGIVLALLIGWLVMRGAQHAEFSSPALFNFVRDQQNLLLGLLVAGVFAVMAGVFIVQTRLRDHRPMAALGMAPPRWRVFGLWWLFAVLLVAPLLTLGCALTNAWAALPSALLAMATAAPFFIVQGGAEEVIFRGWLLQTIGARHGAMIGLVASSVIFALLHLDPNETVLGMVVSVVLRAPLGLALGLLALRYSSLWAGFGMHAGWNAAMFAEAALQAAKTGQSPWMALLAAKSHTMASDLLDPEFLVLVALMLFGLAVVWFTSGDVRGRLTARVQAAPLAVE